MVAPSTGFARKGLFEPEPSGPAAAAVMTQGHQRSASIPIHNPIHKMCGLARLPWFKAFLKGLSEIDNQISNVYRRDRRWPPELRTTNRAVAGKPHWLG
jgi:hypothetical protein